MKGSRFAPRAVLLCAAFAFGASAQDLVPPIEYSKFLKSAEMVGPLSDDLFGDQVSMYNGQTEFVVTDASLAGNSALPVALTRRFSVAAQNSPTAYGGFGIWDVDVPHLSGTFATGNRKWDVGYGGTTQRCSQFFMADAPPNVYYDDVNKGVQMHIPGRGDQELIGMHNSGNPMPNDGRAYIWGTRDGARFQCTPNTANGYPGEGFIALLPDGSRYTFNVALEKTDVSMRISRTSSVGRVKIYLLASRAEDRFGNWVNYQYDGGRITSITSNDGRSIVFSYAGSNISSATVNGRVWNYAYAAGDSKQLSSVTAPDGSRHSYQYLVDGAPSTQLKPRYVLWDGSDGGCPDSDYTPTGFTLLATHPSGASGRFDFSYSRHRKSGVPITACVLTPNSGYQLRTPDYFDLYTLNRKEVSGPGLPSLVWQYAYGSGGSGRTSSPIPCQTCISSKWTSVTKPDGSKLMEQYGTLYRVNDGRLLGKRVVAADGTVLRSEEISYVTDEEAASQPFPDRYGVFLYSAEPSAARIRPVRTAVIHQDSTTYTHRVDSYDAFARPLQVHRYSPWHTRTDATEYFDNLGAWVTGQVSKVTNIDSGHVSSQATYNAQALPERIWSDGMLRQTLTYHADGKPATVTDGNGHATALSSWKLGTPQEIRFADGYSALATVDGNGWITSTTDENGYTSSFTYDVMGRMASRSYPANDTVAWNSVSQSFEQVQAEEYGLSAGHWRQSVSVGNMRKETYFDAFWRPQLVREYDAADVAGTQRFQRTAYDEAGQVAFAAYPASVPSSSNGVWTNYDALGRTTSVASDSEQGLLVTTTQYLPFNQTRVTDPRGKATVTGFHVFDKPDYGSPVWIQHPEGALTTISRNVFGKPLMIRRGTSDDSTFVSRYYVYDSHQRLCKSLEPEAGETVFDYDNEGNLAWSAAGLDLPAQECDRSAAFASGRRVDRSYDARNRLRTLVFADGNGSQTWDYTPDGLPSSVATSNQAGGSQFSNTYSYNRRRLLVAETSGQPDLGTWALGYGYDANGAQASIRYPSGNEVVMSPNALGQATRAGAYASDVSYYPNGGMRSFRYGNGIVHTMEQNARQLPGRVKDGGALDSTYSYDPSGNVSSIADNLDAQRTRSMQYDGLDRLIETTSAAFGGDGVMRYSYDVLDNLRSASLAGQKDHVYWYDASNRLTNVRDSAGATTMGLSYDLQGNLANRNGQAFAFDFGNRLRDVAGLESYRYDAHGRRVVSQSTAGLMRSMYGQDGVLRVIDDARRGISTDYIQLNGSLVARVERLTAPAVPVISLPSFSNSGSYTVSWNSVAHASRYVLQQQDGAGAWANVQDGAATAWSVTGRGEGSYAYRVAACQADACGGWSAVAQVVVALPPAGSPVPTVPSAAYNGTLVVSWSAVAGANRYVLEEKAGAGAWSVVADGGQTSASLAGRPGGSLSYRVTAWNDAGSAPASAEATVVMYILPSQVPLLSAASPSLGGWVSVVWDAVAAAQWYRFEESVNGQGWTVVNDRVTTNWAALNRVVSGAYAYRAAACNAAGCGAYSSPVTVQVIIAPASAPSLSAPGTSTNGSYAISWSAVLDGATYNLQERANGGGWSTIDSPAALASAVGGRWDGAYGYRVQACNAAGCGPWSGEVGVTVLHPVAGTPSISAPGSVNGLTYTVSWGAVDRASSYNIEESLPSGWSGQYTGATGTSSVFTKDSGPQTWSYRVQACNPSGCGPWSSQVSVYLNVTPPPAVPTGLTKTQRSPTNCSITWNAVSGASYYKLSQGFDVYTNRYTHDGICPASVKVRACNTQGTCSAWSAAR